MIFVLIFIAALIAAILSHPARRMAKTESPCVSVARDLPEYFCTKRGTFSNLMIILGGFLPLYKFGTKYEQTIESLLQICQACSGRIGMDSEGSEFNKARRMAQLSSEGAAELLEISEAEVQLLDSGKRAASTRQITVLHGYKMRLLPKLAFEAEGSLAEAVSLTKPANERARQSALGQFFTPKVIADFMVKLFSPPMGNLKLLDAGAGEGVLIGSFAERWKSLNSAGCIEGYAYELDDQILPKLRSQMSKISGCNMEVVSGDFIEHAAERIGAGTEQDFSHAILNPPYKKIGADSRHRKLVRSVGFETVNLYSAFVGLALEMLKDKGELVAIIPRSFCNGPYYIGFRDFLFSRSAIEHIHVFTSRNEAFGNDEVLQENVVLKLVRSKPQGTVTISTSTNHRFSDYSESSFPFSDIVESDDKYRFIHIPTTRLAESRKRAVLSTSLEELGVACSTGPVVDFRVKEALRTNWVDGCVPLLYPVHFSNGRLSWPKVASKKANAIEVNKDTRSSLWASGYYTVVRRLSSKEERRRVYAAVYDPSEMPSGFIGFENHLNVFHLRKGPIDQKIAWGLAAYLNSTIVDQQMRSFSGHTQVNATDLRNLRYPSIRALEEIGQWYCNVKDCEQTALDDHLDLVLQ